jgi:hypothetical protein
MHPQYPYVLIKIKNTGVPATRKQRVKLLVEITYKLVVQEGDIQLCSYLTLNAHLNFEIFMGMDNG